MGKYIKPTIIQLWLTIDAIMDADDEIIDQQDPEALMALSNYQKAVDDLKEHLHGN